MEGLICCLLPAWVLKWFQFSQKIVSQHIGIEWLKCDMQWIKAAGNLLLLLMFTVRREVHPIGRWVGTGIPSSRSPCLPSLKNTLILHRDAVA